MRNSILFVVFILAFSPDAAPRQPHPGVSSPYFFKDFREAVFLFNDGHMATADVNYNLLTETWFFVDKQDRNLRKEITGMEEISFIKVGDSLFVPKYKQLVRVLQHEPLVTVEYVPVSSSNPKSLSYGGQTETAAVDSYTGLSGKGIISGQKMDNRVVTGIEKVYAITIKRKKKHFTDANSFAKLFEKGKRMEIIQYVKDRHIDFSSCETVLQLLKHFKLITQISPI